MKYFSILRIFAVIGLFTPSLGLLDTLHHGRLGIIPLFEGQREFDRTADGLTITFEEAWEPFKLGNMTQFLDIPMACVVSILLTTFIVHLVAITCLLKLMKVIEASM